MKEKELILRGIVVASMLSNDDKTEILKYLEELIEKAWKYDDLTK